MGTRLKASQRQLWLSAVPSLSAGLGCLINKCPQAPGMSWKRKVLQEKECKYAWQSKRIFRKIYFGVFCVERGKKHVNMHPGKQRFNVLNHLKATDGLKKSASQSL